MKGIGEGIDEGIDEGDGNSLREELLLPSRV